MIPNPLFYRGLVGGMSFCRLCKCWVRRDGETRHTKTNKHNQLKVDSATKFFARYRPQRIAAKRRRK